MNYEMFNGIQGLVLKKNMYNGWPMAVHDGQWWYVNDGEWLVNS